MDTDPKDRQRSRENMLAIALVVLVGGIMLFFLYLVSLGIVGNVLLGGGALVVIGALHYLVWGRVMTEEASAEREALVRQEKREEAAAKSKAANAIQDLARTQGIHEK